MRALPVCLLSVLTSCTGQITGSVIHEDVESEVRVLEGADLADELALSPVREAPEPFARIGLVWDADRPQAIEISTSDDGVTWSPWAPPVVHHIEVEQAASFVGQHEVASGQALYYKLRGTAGSRATYARLELLISTQSESLEDGDESGDGISYAFTVGNAEVHGRAEWSARGTRCSTRLGNAYRMAIHHTETPTNDSMSPQARLRQIQSYHMDVRGWCDVGYHYLMSRDGRLWEGRPGHLLGAHSGGSNAGNIGISVMGSHSSTPITRDQLDSIATLVRGLADANDIPLTRTAIKGHREYKPTSCPGDALFAQLADIVATAAAGGSTPEPEPEPEPEPTPTPGTVSVMGVLYAGSDTSDRIQGATVTLDGRITTTSATGFWQFDGVPEGAYTLTVEAAGYQTVTVTRATYAAESWASLGLSPAAATTGNAVLQGVVYFGSSSSNRIPDAEISLSTGQTVTADANGFYKLTDLPAGPVTITATAPGHGTGSVSRTLVDGETSWGSVNL